MLQSKVSKVEKSWVLGSNYKYFKRQSEAFFRFTYRRDFPALYPYSISSDAGWGCMLRVAQMIMGYTFRRHYFGAEWRPPKNKESLRNSLDYCNILQWFVDYPGYPHIYSLHHLVQCGIKYDKLPGEWFGPSTAALVLRDLAKLHRVKYHGPLEIMVTQGDTIYITEAEKLCCNNALNNNVNNVQLIANTNRNNILLNDELCRTVAEKHHNTQPPPSTATAAPTVAASSKDSADAPGSSGSGSSGSGGGSTSIRDPLSSVFVDPLLNPPPASVAPWAHALMILLPLRLGINSVNDEYIEELKEVLRNPNCVGIIGGRPNRAMYFIGYTSENELLGLDPHTVFCNPDYPTNSAAGNGGSGGNGNKDVVFPSAEYLNQIHVGEFSRLSFSQLDPSLALGFYFSDRESFQKFCNETRVNTAKKLAAGKSPLYAIQHTPPSFMQEYNDDTEHSEEAGGGGLEGSSFSTSSAGGGGGRANSSTNQNNARALRAAMMDDDFGEPPHGGDDDSDDDEYVLV